MTLTLKHARLSIIAALAAVGGLAACNTVRGAGQDVQAGGAAVEDAAEEVQADLEKDKSN